MHQEALPRNVAAWIFSRSCSTDVDSEAVQAKLDERTSSLNSPAFPIRLAAGFRLHTIHTVNRETVVNRRYLCDERERCATTEIAVKTVF
jgi:hypothetical protein